MLVFEDLHWADDDLLEFVDELAEQLDAVPLLLVCTARPELLSRRPGWGGGKLNAVTLSLGRLSDDETAQLLAAVLDRSVLPAETQAALLERAEGVPLFAEEYARMLATGDAGGALPDTLQGVVAARIDGLPEEAKELLQDASVLGKVFWTDALAELRGVKAHDLDEGLRLLERREFVRRERRSAVEGARQYVFLHAVVRDVAYGQLPRAARAVRHRATARWIAGLPEDRGDDRAETLVHHLESALGYGEAAGVDVSDLRPLLARALGDAGDRAQALNAHARAADYYARALQAGDPERPDPELVFAHARALGHTEDVEVADRVLRDATETLLAAGRDDLAALSLSLLHRRLWNVGRLDRSLNQRALQLVEGMGPVAVQGRVISAVAASRAIGGRAHDALPLAREAVEIARAVGDRDAEAVALNNLSIVLAQSGDAAAATEAARAGAELALRIGSSDLPRPLEPGRDGGDARSARGRRASLSRRSGARASPRQPYRSAVAPRGARHVRVRTGLLGRGGAWRPGSPGLRRRPLPGRCSQPRRGRDRACAGGTVACRLRERCARRGTGDRGRSAPRAGPRPGSIPPLGGRRGGPGRAVAQRVRRCVDRRRVLPAGPVVCRPRPGVARRGRRRRAGGPPARACRSLDRGGRGRARRPRRRGRRRARVRRGGEPRGRRPAARGRQARLARPGGGGAAARPRGRVLADGGCNGAAGDG